MGLSLGLAVRDSLLSPPVTAKSLSKRATADKVRLIPPDRYSHNIGNGVVPGDGASFCQGGEVNPVRSDVCHRTPSI